MGKHSPPCVDLQDHVCFGSKFGAQASYYRGESEWVEIWLHKDAVVSSKNGIVALLVYVLDSGGRR